VKLEADFFDRSVHDVARDLIGCTLLYEGRGGVIVETESYDADDPACHAYVGLTERTRVLFGPPGRAYVYLSYGIHSLLNAVAEPEGHAAAVLIRALEPTHGIEQMRARRGHKPDLDLCSGPGKLTEALGIDLSDNEADLGREPFLITKPEGDPSPIVTSPRIGITKAVDRPWRFSAARPPHPAVMPPPPPPDSGAASGAASGVASGVASGSGADSVSGAGSTVSASGSGSYSPSGAS
jgi:DNA-3-methyladenine glycosylase